MNTAYHPTYGPNPSDVRHVNRLIRWSIAVHLGIVLVAALVPREWLGREEPRRIMTISLGGTPGPRSTGTTSIGGRTVEEVAPPPRRPEPVRPVPPEQPEAAAAIVRTPPSPETTPAPAPRPATPRPPATGAQVARGSTRAETGAVGQAAGLSFGGEGLGGETNLADFCCPWYLDRMLDTIDSHWRKDQPERGGTTILRFTVARSGAIEQVAVEQSSGSGPLDRAARAALADTRLPPLPGEYTSETLIIHLRFPYGRQ